MKRVVAYSAIPEDLLLRLQEHHAVTTFDHIHVGNRATFVAAVHAAHGLLGASVAITRELLEPARDLEAISTISVGYDQFDVDYLTTRGIVLSHTPDVVTESTADTIVALMLASARRVVELAEFVRAGNWKRSIDSTLYGVDVHGKTLGILGMGRIGRAVARRARLGFGMDILYYGRRDAPEAESAFGARRLPLDELLKTSDFVCVVLPLDASTEQLIGEREFSLMKPGAIFINGARGRIVDESALVAALESGRLRAAGLDVFEREPLAPSSPLAQLPNVVALPHAGSATVETRYAMCQLAVDNLISALAGRPRHVVNLSAMARRRSAAAQLEPGK